MTYKEAIRILRNNGMIGVEFSDTDTDGFTIEDEATFVSFMKDYSKDEIEEIFQI